MARPRSTKVKEPKPPKPLNYDPTIEVDDAVVHKTTGCVFTVVELCTKHAYSFGYNYNSRTSEKPAFKCKKICDSSGKEPSKKSTYHPTYFRREMVKITEDNYEQYVEAKVTKLKDAMEKIKPLLKFQERRKRASPLK